MSTFGSEFIGRVLGGRYRLVAPVGTGASATVFQADDVQLRRTVAVKVLHPSLAADPAFLKRFRAEAQSAAGLSHPNILAVFDWGEDHGQPYLVVEFLAGGSLRSMLDVGRRLSPSQALVVGLDVARGLDYAHRRGLVHRDIKPANLLFGEDRRLRIGDFGLARAIAEAAWTEPAGVVLGTARYASPEQAKGLNVNGKTDIYSLALVLCEATTGRVPFAADTTVATLQNRIDKLMPVTADMGPLAAIIERSGRPDPAERFDASELGRALIGVAERLARPEPLPIVRLHVSAARSDETMVAGPAVERTPGDGPGRERPREERPIPERPAVAAGGSGGTEQRDMSPRPAAEHVYVESPAPPQSIYKRLALGAVGGLGAVVLAGVVVWFVALRDSTPSYAVPSFIGQTIDQANNNIVIGDWKLVITSTRVDGHEAGDIVSQTPEAFTMLGRGETITVVVSDGLPLVAVPSLMSMTEPAAAELLKSVNLSLGVRTEAFDEIQPVGVILSWGAAGESAQIRTPIDYTVSAGPAPRTLPAREVLAGKTYDEAAATLTALQLVVVREDRFDEKVEAGLVVALVPEFGTTAKRGDTVTVAVSKGPELIPVPNVTGKTVAEAVAEVKAVGLKEGNATGLAGGRVIASSPAAGTPVRKASKVDFVTG